MTLNELENMIAQRWQTIMVLEDQDMGLFLDCLDKGGSASSWLDDNGCVISIAPGNEYALKFLLSDKIANAEVVKMYADHAFLVVFVRMDEDWYARGEQND